MQRSIQTVLLLRRKRLCNGAVIVELAICVTVLIFLLLAFFQYGQILYHQNRLNQLLREAGIYSSRHWSDNNFNSNSATTNSLRYYMRNLIDVTDNNNLQNGVATSDYPFHYSDLTLPSNFLSPTPGTNDPVTGLPACTSGKFMTITIQYDISKAYFWKSLFPSVGSSNIITRSVTVLMY